MRGKLSLLLFGILVTITGCGSEHPDFTLFKHVPASQISDIKSTIQAESIKNLELPTKLPYTVTEVQLPNPPINPTRKHFIEIFMGDKTHVLDMQALSVPQNSSINAQNMAISHERVTSLTGGVHALYGVNNAASQLVWDTNGVQYFLRSTNSNNQPDLTEQQLVAVADSFQ